MYVWHGKLSPTEQRRISAQLGKELWSQGYDYSKCDINPIYPTSQRESHKCNNERPEWALLAKVNQHMETVLFKEKFFNWPNEDAKTKRRNSSDSDVSTYIHLINSILNNCFKFKFNLVIYNFKMLLFLFKKRYVYRNFRRIRW